MNLVISPKLSSPARSWITPIRNARYTAIWSGGRPIEELAAIVAATIRLIELVGPNTWWCDEKKSEPTNPPMTTEAITGPGGRLRIKEKPIAWGIETRVT